RDTEIPIQHKTPGSKVTFCAPGKFGPSAGVPGSDKSWLVLTAVPIVSRERSARPATRGGLPVPKPRGPGATRSSRSLPRLPVRRRQPLRHPREESHAHEEGYSAGETNPWHTGRVGLTGCGSVGAFYMLLVFPTW